MFQWLKSLGGTYELIEPGKQTLPDGTQLDIPPICFGELGHDKSKKTILVYGHLDVQPALKSDGWDTEPFVLTEKDGKLYGRGSTDDKVRDYILLICQSTLKVICCTMHAFSIPTMPTLAGIPRNAKSKFHMLSAI